MADRNPSYRNLWLLVIALLAVVVVIFVLNPTRGEDEAQLRAVAEDASIDRLNTLEDHPRQAEPYGKEGDVELVIPEGEETGVLEPGENVSVAE